MRKGRKHHYKSRTTEYKTWSGLRTRCYNKDSRPYKYYGGRGIYVCDRWLESFQNFLEDMGEKPSRKHSLDRIDNNKGYYKENCRWATYKQQMRNVSNNRNITINGRTQCLSAWAEETGLNKFTIRSRLERGVKPEDAISPLVEKRNIILVYNGLTASLPKWARIVGISESTLRQRVRLGWSDNDVIEIRPGARRNSKQIQNEHAVETAQRDLESTQAISEVSQAG